VSANAAFERGRYDQALKGYQSAAKTLGESPELDYNRAAAQYKLGRHDEAANLFAKAALSPEPALSRRARFNWGNCDYAATLDALQSAAPDAGQMPDLAAAVERLESAVRHYRDALAAGGDDPSDQSVDRAARANTERAQRLIEMIKEQQQQQEQQQQEQQQQDQQQDDQQEQDDQQQQQDQPDEQQENQQQDDQQQDQQQQAGEQQDEQQDEQQEQQQPQPDQQRQMTPEEVEAVLQEVRDREQQRRDEKMRRVRAQRVPVVRDW